MATEHADHHPPSAAKRWINCPYSDEITEMYPNDKSLQSLKGDRWHEYMDTLITFGTLPLATDADAAEELEVLNDYVKARVRYMGPGTRTFIEQRVDVPESKSWGTADIILVSPQELEIIDEKSGYVPVKVELNDQLMTYLLGAINLYGERPKYTITIHQPGYDHIEGPLRSFNPTTDELLDFSDRVKASLKAKNTVVAGPWCKETYCPHRGACRAFHDYTKTSLAIGWHTSEVKAITDGQLAMALDASDELGGYRTELRVEAMRRILNMDRIIDGYKVVKGRRSRSVIDPQALVNAVLTNLGPVWAARMFPDLSWAQSTLEVQLATGFMSEELLKCLGTPKHIEDVIKSYARQTGMSVRGGWKNVYDAVVGPYIRETANGLSLEKAIDGRPAHKRGSEFGTVEDPATSPNVLNLTTII
jgi:hypothetical protein